MRRVRKSLILLVGLALFLAACGGGATPQATPVPEAQITLTTHPNPPAVGDIELVFDVADREGQPVTGANVDVIADHTDMGGMTMHGVATEQGNGRYAITAGFSMAGKWVVTVQVKNAALDYRTDLELQIK